jgi:nicotinamidase-related amidase
MTPGLSASAEEMLALHLRSRAKVEGKDEYAVKEDTAAWPAKKTALIICDMWDDHWCKGAARRVAEMAGPTNEMVHRARDKGVLIVHCPSSVTSFYNDTPQRRLAQKAPFAPAPTPLSILERWGTAWCWTDGKREGVLPIDDSDMGCDCDEKCPIRQPWTRQIATIEISKADAITDNGQEVWNLLTQRGIDNVMICGVHLNMCVLGRPFGIRQMTKLGKRVALIRDMTDTMYNHERPPGVNHFRGTDLMVEHVEKYWCPSFTSTDLTGRPAFQFKEAAVVNPDK